MNTVETRLDASGLRVGIVAARFNHLITRRLLEGCEARLTELGCDQIDVMWVPGAFEIPLAAQAAALAAEVQADTPTQLKALANPLRVQILDLVLERAATVTELAAALDRPKSSVAYHVDTLVEAGLLQVVRTRRVRAIEERFYGRTGRTIVLGDRLYLRGHDNLYCLGSK